MMRTSSICTPWGVCLAGQGIPGEASSSSSYCRSKGPKLRSKQIKIRMENANPINQECHCRMLGEIGILPWPSLAAFGLWRHSEGFILNRLRQLFWHSTCAVNLGMWDHPGFLQKGLGVHCWKDESHNSESMTLQLFRSGNHRFSGNPIMGSPCVMCWFLLVFCVQKAMWYHHQVGPKIIPATESRAQVDVKLLGAVFPAGNQVWW